MKLLYIVPTINNEGGVARVLATKTSYLAEKFGYEIHIMTQNHGDFPRFYTFDQRIIFHDIQLKGTIFKFFNSYRIALKKKIENIQPDCIVVCDNGLKAYTIPFLLGKNKIPVILELHGSKYVEEWKPSDNFFRCNGRFLKYKFKDLCAGMFAKVVFLSQESAKEWNLKNGAVIPNPLWLTTDVLAASTPKRILTVARN